MLSVPRRANDALHLSNMTGFDGDINAQGEMISQEQFQVQMFRKSCILVDDQGQGFCDFTGDVRGII